MRIGPDLCWGLATVTSQGLHFATLAVALTMVPTLSCAQAVPDVVVSTPIQSTPSHASVTYSGVCRGGAFSLSVTQANPIRPNVVVRLGDAEREYGLEEPFVRDLFIGNRYELVRATCYGDGLQFLVLLGYSRDVEDRPIFAVGSVYFDDALNVTTYDGLTEEATTSSMGFVNRDFYERMARCTAQYETDTDIEVCAYPGRRPPNE